MKLPSTTYPYAPVVLRLGLVCVYAWFGYMQLADIAAWELWVPAWASGLMPAHTVVLINGTFELLAAALLLAGYYTRAVALVLAVHLLLIAFDIGLSAIGVRDFGLAMATLALGLGAPDTLTLDARTKRPPAKAPLV